MRDLDRRRFLQWAWLAPAALVIGSNPACRRSESESGAPSANPRLGKGRTQDPERIVAELQRRFRYLELDEDSLARYARDYLRHLGPPSLAGNDLYSRFLLSSDFFPSGADESSTVHYVAFYDPYVTACRNPLARLDD